jgi:ABC-type transport system involved in cytochrome bd biosynthesis fused ATPase/permease subunit
VSYCPVEGRTVFVIAHRISTRTGGDELLPVETGNQPSRARSADDEEESSGFCQAFA